MPDCRLVKVDSALQDPSDSTFERKPGSARRTSHIDMERIGPTSREGARLTGAARDLITDGRGQPKVISEARFEAELGPERILRSLRTNPGIPPGLEGRVVAGGFRAQVDRLLAAEAEEQTPLHLLVDDLPVAALIAGYADLYLGPIRITKGIKADICSGWVQGGTMLRRLEDDGEMPIPIGPEAPLLDGHGWHDMPELQPGAMRRRRMVDVAAGTKRGDDHAGGNEGTADTPGHELIVRAMFRDTHVNDEGQERVLHEYQLRAVVDRRTRVFTECTALPKVLPWPECPSAAASAAGLVGRATDEVRDYVKRNLRGVGTCTHLNDLLRSLADLAPLIKVLSP